MNTHSHMRIFLLLGLMLVLALSGCDRKATAPIDGTAPSVRINANTTGSGVQLDSTNAFVRIVVEGDRFGPLDSTYTLVAGRFFEAALDLPVGVPLTVTLTAEEIISVNQSVTPWDTTSRVIYSGTTTAVVQQGDDFTIEVDLLPVVPMVRLAPRFIEIPSGESFLLELQVRNMPGLALIDVVIDFGYFGDDLLLPINGLKGPTLGNSVSFSASLVNDDTEYEVFAADTSLPARSITDAAGNVTLATIEFDSKQQAEKAAQALTSVTLAVTSAIDISGTIINVQTLATDQADISLLPVTDQVVTFPDPELRNAVIRAWNVGDPNNILLSEVLNITYLESTSDAGQIADLTNINLLQNLEDVYFQYQNFTDLKPLGEIQSLIYVTLYGGDITDVSPLANLRRVRTLDLGFNQFDNVQPLTAMSSLTELFINGNFVRSLAGFEQLTELRWLDVSNNQISVITPLADLTNIANLNLSYNSITNIATLLQNPGLGAGDVVDLTGNPLDDVSIRDHIKTLEGRGVTVIFGTK